MPTIRDYKLNHRHEKLENDLIADRWKSEREIEKKVENECWVKSMVVDSAKELNKIAKLTESLISEIFGDVDGLIDECRSPLISKLKDVLRRLEHEEKSLQYYVDIDGTMSKFAAGVKIHPLPKYVPDLSPRPEWNKCDEKEAKKCDEKETIDEAKQ